MCFYLQNYAPAASLSKGQKAALDTACRLSLQLSGSTCVGGEPAENQAEQSSSSGFPDQTEKRPEEKVKPVRAKRGFTFYGGCTQSSLERKPEPATAQIHEF